jgi:uncharacterized membrane protein YcaP (DUF421 family)
MNDLQTFLLGDQEWAFLLECAIRAVIMFIVVLSLFKLTGKKEVRQFSILELVVLIGLGSALGDPMFYEDVGILPAAVAMMMVLLCYRVANTITNRNKKAGEWLSGTVVTVFANGIIDRKALDREGWSVEEFFGDLRASHVEHLGQVKAAHVEVDGELSIFFHSDDDVVPGLPISPDRLRRPLVSAGTKEGAVSCVHCGSTYLELPQPGSCPHCSGKEWLASLSCVRVA